MAITGRSGWLCRMPARWWLEVGLFPEHGFQYRPDVIEQLILGFCRWMDTIALHHTFLVIDTFQEKGEQFGLVLVGKLGDINSIKSLSQKKKKFRGTTVDTKKDRSWKGFLRVW